MIFQNNNTIFSNEYDAIFQNILVYLDPNSIGNLVLCCRTLRKTIGGVINKVIQEQQKYCNMILDGTQFTISYLQYKSLLNELHIFNNEQEYSKFIDCLVEYNRHYYRNFFTIALGYEVKINKKNISFIKDQLKLIQNEVYLGLLSLQFYKNIPHISNNRIYDIESTSAITSFVNKFLQLVSLMQKQIRIKGIDDNSILNSYIAYSKSTEYIKQFRKIKDIKMDNRYSVSMYYLSFKHTYHTMINFNLNSVILSFLTIKDLQKLRSVDRIFNSLVKQISIIIYQKIQFKIDKIVEDMDQSQNIKSILTMIYENDNSYLQKREYDLVQYSQQQPQQIDLTNQILLKLLGYVGINSREFYIFKNSISIYNAIYNHPYSINLNDYQHSLLEHFMKIADESVISSYNILSKRIYNTLKIIYQLKQYGLTYDDILLFKKSQIYLHKQTKQLNQYIKYSCILNNPKLD